MATNKYSKYKIAIDPDSKKVQGLRVGDVVRRQYFDTPNLIYSLMVVIETGVDIIAGKESHYFIGALLEGDEPRSGELLDFVRVTSLMDRSRGGALYLTASDSDSPYMDVIDGLGFEHSLLYLSEIHKTQSQFTFPLNGKVGNPEMLLISFRVRASKSITNAKLSVGYSDETDGEDSFDISTDWSYRLSTIIMNYPSQYARTLTINPNLSADEWCEISDLNVVRLSDIATFAKATKARMGKITGIIDPVFGMLEGYGAYFQNLYATRNVNIAGTLTAGDENGFASTFYVGKIHKNVILNSAESAFSNSAVVNIPSPVGFGKVRKISTDSSLAVQSSAWREERIGRVYSFSIWVQSELGAINFYQDEHHIGSTVIEVAGEWRRYKLSFKIKSSVSSSMIIRLVNDIGEILVTAPQLESGESASQYQPTDGTLNYTEDYGAWFNKGGIGGTIQNPLLKLNEDGSISSIDDSFVINRDGTGHFASGAMRWNRESIQFAGNVKLEWDNLSDEAQNIIKEQAQTGAMPEWIQDWNSNTTTIGSQSVVTPKIFAGTKNSNGTITGVALGRFTVNSRNAQGVIITESIDGIYGFNDGYKTFQINTSGSVNIGRGNEYIRYNALTGEIEFGSAVSMRWIGATYIDANGIFTGALSANTVNAININASQITAGTISANRIDVNALKATLITASNINALTLNVTKGKIGGWFIDTDSIFRGTKNNTSGAYTSASGAMTIGSNGIRGFKWRLDSTGAGAVAGGNIAWDASGNVTFADSVALLWNAPISDIKTALGGEEFPKMTHITSTGIYTGILTASQITAGTISADRIATGSITASKLDAVSVKADIINVGYINGLSCTFTKGTIGGWTINSGSISNSQIIIDNTNKRIAVYGASSSSTSGQRVQLYYNSNIDFGFIATDSTGNRVATLGAVNQIAGWSITNTQISKNNVVLGANGSIVNGTKWKLNNDGSGQIANGNISWSAAGTVTFSSAVSLAWTTPINNINTALGGTSFTKLTYISSTGIYTGTLTATQVNAVGISASSITTGTLNADRIASGSITSVKLDAASIKSNIINTDYINGLSCTFVRGTIGGFTIGSDNMSVGSVGTVGQTPIQIRTSSIGSGYWYSGAYKPFGICMTWYQSSNAGHIVLGQIAASGNSVKSNFIGLQMMSWDGLEYFCLSTNYTLSGSKQVYNRIAGWGFDSQNIWKNSVYLGSDGSIYNGTKWRLDNSGSGRLANGNIVWDSSGNVTFGASVSLNWTNAATNALNQAKTYADTKKTEAINAAASDATTKANAAKELASAMAYGRMLYRDPTFYHGTNSTNVYNNAGNGTVSITRVSNSNAPNDSKMVLRIQNTGTASPECGGFYFGTTTSYRKIFIARIIANIPTGRSIGFASNSVGSGGNYYWLTPTAGTGDWCEYVAKVVCGTSSFSSTNFFYITGATGVTWDVAYATVFDVTSVEKMTTTIDANGIYTGTLNANQITAGTIDATRINTEAIKSAIITATNINALTLTTTKGSIGGWSITSTQISKNSVALSSDGSIVNGTKWRLNNDGSGQLANGNISWDTAGNITARNAMFNNVRIQGSVRNPFVLNDSSIWVGGDTTNQQNFNNYDNIVPVRGSWNELINLPWTLQNSGRRVVLVNYKWNSTITQGFMDISAPSGKYFYEDGIAKSRIQFSREVIELLGYGDNVTFFGWIVLNRHNIMTDSRYGKTIKILAQGRVTGTSSSASITYKTFDNTSMSVSRIGEGKYRVYYSSLWGLSLSNAVFNLTGYGYSWGSSSAPIKASVYGVYSSYFDVNVSDDASNNDGSFYFQIANMNDWTY